MRSDEDAVRTIREDINEYVAFVALNLREEPEGGWTDEALDALEAELSSTDPVVAENYQLLARLPVGRSTNRRQ